MEKEIFVRNNETDFVNKYAKIEKEQDNKKEVGIMKIKDVYFNVDGTPRRFDGPYMQINDCYIGSEENKPFFIKLNINENTKYKIISRKRFGKYISNALEHIKHLFTL